MWKQFEYNKIYSYFLSRFYLTVFSFLKYFNTVCILARYTQLPSKNNILF